MVEEKVRARCPRCGTVIHWERNAYRPFCSQQCKLIDLGKWIDEEYRLIGDDSPSRKEEERGLKRGDKSTLSS